MEAHRRLRQRARHGFGHPGAGSGRARQRRRQGLRRQGIGLPLARQIIEAHGGSLEMVSQPGEGTAAIVDLP